MISSEALKKYINFDGDIDLFLRYNKNFMFDKQWNQLDDLKLRIELILLNSVTDTFILSTFKLMGEMFEDKKLKIIFLQYILSKFH